MKYQIKKLPGLTSSGEQSYQLVDEDGAKVIRGRQSTCEQVLIDVEDFIFASVAKRGSK